MNCPLCRRGLVEKNIGLVCKNHSCGIFWAVGVGWFWDLKDEVWKWGVKREEWQNDEDHYAHKKELLNSFKKRRGERPNVKKFLEEWETLKALELEKKEEEIDYGKI